MRSPFHLSGACPCALALLHQRLLWRAVAWATANGDCARTPEPPAPSAVWARALENPKIRTEPGAFSVFAGAPTRHSGRWRSPPGAGPIRRCHRGDAPERR